MSLRTRTLRSGFILSILGAVFFLLASAGTAPAPAQPAPKLQPAFTIAGGEGYWFVATDGGIFSYGPDAGFHGSAGNIALNKPIVGMAPAPANDGYWLVATDGGIFSYGPGSTFHGSTGSMALNKPVVGMAPTGEGDGYYLVASDGGVFAYGNSPFYGSTGSMRLNSPVVGIALTPTGEGYYMVARDGGVFAFGDAASRFYGSLGGAGIDNIVGIVPTMAGEGYWLVGADGRVYNFGDAPFYGDMHRGGLSAPLVSMAVAGIDEGYWLVAANGGLYSFGDAPSYGPDGPIPNLNKPIVGMAAAPLYLISDVPQAVNDSLTVDEDASASVDVLANDNGLSDGVSIARADAPVSGTATCSGSSCTYTPNANFNGADFFTYTITDADGDTATGTVDVTVTAVDDLVAATDDALTTAEDADGTIDVAANDTAPDGDIAIAAGAAPASGTVTCSGSSCTYTPNANFNGADSFTYTITDGDGSSDTGTVTVTVTPVDDGPVVAAADSATTPEDTPAASIDVLANDTNKIDTPLSVAIATAADNGTAIVNSDRTITYTPSADFNGGDSFAYAVTDHDGQVSTATVTLSITAVDDLPVANADALAVDEDTAGTATVLSNDTGLGDGGIVQTIDAQGTKGTAIVNADRTITYTPNADATGSDSFTYKLVDADGDEATGAVSVTIAAVDDVVGAVADTAATNEDIAVVTAVLANDTGTGDAPLTVVIATQGTKGTAVANGDGTVTYTPSANLNGSDTYSYTVTDADGDASTAAVAITITPVDDGMPDAVNDSYSVNEDSVLTVPSAGRASLLANDTSLQDGVALSIVTQPTKGALSGVGQDGSFTYTPKADLHGNDSFTYRLTDTDGQQDIATVALSIVPVNDVPLTAADTATTTEDVAVKVPVLANDTGLGDSPLTLTIVAPAPTLGVATVNADKTITYTPNVNANGSDAFGYKVRDSDGQESTATVSVTISGLNDAPVAVNDSLSTNEDVASAPLNVLANDSDPEQAASSLTVAIADQGTKGVAVVNPDKTITYTPKVDVNGADSFTYRLTDDGGASTTGTVDVVIAAVDDLPALGDDAVTVAEDAAVTTVEVLANDTGLGDGVPSLTLDGAATKGVATCSGTTCTYRPNPDAFGADSFVYRVTDADGDFDTANVAVTVTAVDDLPVATADAATTNEDTPAIVNVLANDTGLGDGVTVSIATQGVKGTSVANADGTVTYTPVANANTAGAPADVIVYRVTDADGDTSTAELAMKINAVSDTTPVAANDASTVKEDESIATPVLDNDTGDVDFLKVTIATAPTKGSAVVGADRKVTYTPGANYFGSDTYTYTITDSDGESSTATVTITVTPINDTAPVAVADSAETLEDRPVVVSVLDNDQLGVDGTALTLEPLAPTNGTATCGTTTCTFTPAKDYSGIGRFSYRITDVDGQFSVAAVEIGIVGENETPNSVNDAKTTNEDTAVDIDVLANDTQLDQPPNVSITIVSQGSKGTAAYDPAKHLVTYTPVPNANTAGGPADTFTYRVTDADGDVGNTATVSVTITAVSDVTPFARNDTATASRSGGPQPIDIRSNDFLGTSNIDHATYALTSGINPSGSGTVSCTSDGACTYTPTVTAYTDVWFTYRITDSDGQTSTARVDIKVGA